MQHIAQVGEEVSDLEEEEEEEEEELVDNVMGESSRKMMLES